MRKKVVSAILCASMVAGMVVIPGVAVKADDKKQIGVTMPTKDLQRWNQDGENMKKELEVAGYEVDLQYASNDVSTQVSQLDDVTIAQRYLDMVGKKQDILRKTKNALHRTGHFCCKIMLYADLLLHLQRQPDNL